MGHWKLLCRLPEPIRAFFFRTLDHPWALTYLSADGYTCEQECERCQAKRYYLPEHCSSDGLSVTWQPGPLPATVPRRTPSPAPAGPHEQPHSSLKPAR